MAIFESQRWMNTNIWEAAHQYLAKLFQTRDFEQQDGHLGFVWNGGCPKELHHYRNLAEEHQITIQIEESQTQVKPANNPTPLHFGDKCEAIVVEEDGCPYDRLCKWKSGTLHHEMERIKRTESNNF